MGERHTEEMRLLGLTIAFLDLRLPTTEEQKE